MKITTNVNLDSINKKMFKVESIFPKLKIKKYPSIPKQIGNIRFISSTSINNGVAKKVAIIGNPVKSNCITVSTNGACFDAFYHPYPIMVSSDVEVLRNLNLNPYNSMYIITILNANKLKYNFGNKPKKNAVFNSLIELPCDVNGDPDWIFMENYTKIILKSNNLELNFSQKYLNNLKRHPINYENWKKFNITEIFSLQSAKKCIDKKKIIDSNPKKYNYITRTALQNGLLKKIGIQEKSIINKGNCISIGLDTQTVFYQVNDFYCGQNIQIIRNSKLNKYNALFIVTILEKYVKSKFSWGSNGATITRLKSSYIKLPCDINGDPDWIFMENYIQRTAFSKYI